MNVGDDAIIVAELTPDEAGNVSFVSSDDSSDDDEENLKILNPIFQVIFYENGTIDDIKYYSKVNTFLKSFMIDFIKKNNYQNFIKFIYSK